MLHGVTYGVAPRGVSLHGSRIGVALSERALRGVAPGRLLISPCRLLISLTLLGVLLRYAQIRAASERAAAARVARSSRSSSAMRPASALCSLGAPTPAGAHPPPRVPPFESAGGRSVNTPASRGADG